jgi:hypothetical protein
MADSNRNMGNSGLMKCPVCGSENPVVAVFCRKCGKKFTQQPSQQTAQQPFYPPPPPPPTGYPTVSPNIRQSHRKMNIVIVAVAVVLVVVLAFAAVLAVPLINGPQPTPTPTPTHTPQPTNTPTAVPTVKPTPTPTPYRATPQPLNSTITAINLQFVYQGSDQQFFGPTSQSLSFSNQPNGMLSIYQGTQFWYSFKLTSGNIVSQDSIVSITTSTPGFTVASTTPQTPITFTAGSSQTISIWFNSPQTTFDGPVNVIMTTSG